MSLKRQIRVVMLLDTKQHLGFKDCLARSQQALDIHFNLMNFARSEAWRGVEPGQEGAFSMYSHKCRAFNQRLIERYFSRLGFAPSSIKRHPTYQYATGLWGARLMHSVRSIV